MIHVITGPPCGGKTTYVSKHAKKNDLRVDFDEISVALGAAEKWNPVGIVQRATMNARKAAIKTALNSPGAESWIIQSRLSEELRKKYEDAGAEIVEIDPGKDECIARAKRDGRPKNIFLAIEGWYAGKKGGKMKTKDFVVQYKDEGSGSVEGYASTWIRQPDSYGDVVAKGAFEKTLKERWNGGKGIPFLWSHHMDDLNSIIGTAEADEDEKGLHFIAKFDNTEEAQKVRQFYKDGRLRKFSFAFDVRECAMVTLEDNTKANELRELDLFEISAVMVPANDDAGVVDVKAGRRNSKSDEDDLREAIKLIQKVLGEIEEGEPEDGEDEPKGNAAAKDPKESNPKKKELLEYINKI